MHIQARTKTSVEQVDQALQLQCDRIGQFFPLVLLLLAQVRFFHLNIAGLNDKYIGAVKEYFSKIVISITFKTML